MLNTSDEYTFFGSYMDYLLSFYGPSQRYKIKEIAVTIALFPSITIKNYYEYMNCPEITYEFVGLLNDLCPVLTVLHEDGESVYKFADTAYSKYVLDKYQDVVVAVIDYFYLSLDKHLNKYLYDDDFREKTQEKELQGGKKLNHSIIFFSEGLSGIWNSMTDENYIRNQFLKNTYIIDLYRRLNNDQWAKTGYGLYLKSELAECIFQALDYCISNSMSTNAFEWSKYVCDQENGLNNEHGLGLKELIKEDRYLYIYKSVVRNQNSLKNLRDWFWVLVSQITDETVQVLQDHGVLDDFDYFVIRYYDYEFFNPDFCAWNDKLLESKTDKKNIDHEVISSVIKTSPESCEEAKTIYDDYMEEYISKNEKILTNFNILWNDMDEEDKAQLSAFILFSAPYHDKKGVLQSAFYKRLRFERDKGNINGFMMSLCYGDNYFIQTLKNEYKNKNIREDEIYQYLNSWINVTIQCIYDGEDQLIKNLNNVTIEGVKWLNSINKNVEAMELLERYVYSFDAETFLRFYSETSDSLVSNDSAAYANNSMVYCTNNVINLLDYYQNESMYKRFYNGTVKLDHR